MLPIIITGGPCAGKTSVLQFLSTYLPEFGVTPVLVPEAATTLIQGGISPASVGVVSFQAAVFALHLANEAVFGEGSTHLRDKNPLLVFDRGLMDGKAYMQPADFQRMIDSHNLTEDEILSRYGLILHLESAAVGKPELYSSETNDARYEERGTAVVVEQNTLAVWDGHPNRRVIPCYDDFDVKCERVLAEVLAYVESQRD